jgi:hypothetical protein
MKKLKIINQQRFDLIVDTLACIAVGLAIGLCVLYVLNNIEKFSTIYR